MLGNKNEKTGTLLILKPVSKVNGESVKPFFEVSTKDVVTNKWIPSTDNSINSISGSLFKIEAVEEEYKGDKYFRVKAIIKDKDEAYLIPFRMNIATRSLLNSFFNLESFENISIRYYLSKAGYDSYYVTQNDEKVTWKFESSELPPPEEISFKGKIIRDFTKIDLFFVDQIKILNERIKLNPTKASEETGTKSFASDESESWEAEEEVPF
jgi:hypothetical protein